MNNSIYKAAKNFIKKGLNGNIDIKTVSSYLQQIGYSVIFYNPNDDNDILLKYGLQDYSKTVKAFSVRRKDFKAVFVDNTIPCENKLYSLLHETGHIVLGHLDKSNTQEQRLSEMEAEAFAYEVLHLQQRVNIMPLLAVLLVCFSCIGLYMHRPTNNIATPSTVTFIPQTTAMATAAPTQPPTESSVQLKNPMDIVYVTRTGHKYHRADCQYTKDKDCTTLTREEAQKNYAPCSVCKP